MPQPELRLGAGKSLAPLVPVPPRLQPPRRPKLPPQPAGNPQRLGPRLPEHIRPGRVSLGARHRTKKRRIRKRPRPGGETRRHALPRSRRRTRTGDQPQAERRQLLGPQQVPARCGRQPLPPRHHDTQPERRPALRSGRRLQCPRDPPPHDWRVTLSYELDLARKAAPNHATGKNSSAALASPVSPPARSPPIAASSISTVASSTIRSSRASRFSPRPSPAGPNPPPASPRFATTSPTPKSPPRPPSR